MKRIDDRVSPYKQQQKRRKNDRNEKGKTHNRYLINVNVSGSTGPIRFVVNSEDSAGQVIETALKLYARQGRHPALGFDLDNFLLYATNAGFDALKPSDAIGSRGVRSFALCKKESGRQMIKQGGVEGKRGGRTRWLQKSLSLRNLFNFSRLLCLKS